MINNRQNGRRRGRGGPQVRNGAGNGPERGNRIDNRARGNAAQLHEKYRNLARDAQTQGDRVMTEYYLQFADHYFRVLSEGRARFEEQNPNQAQQRRQFAQSDDFDEGFEGDPGDENSDGEQAQRRFDREPRREAAYDEGEQPASQNGDNGYQRDNQQQYRDDQRNRGNRDNSYNRDSRGEGRGEGRNEGRNENRYGQQGRSERDNRPAVADRDEQPRDAYQPREAAPVEAVIPPQPVEAEAPRPRRGRPPRNAAPVAAEGEAKAQIEVDRLPPAFALEAPEPAPAPRTRRKAAAPAPEAEVRAVEGEPAEPAPRRRRTRREPTDDSNVAA